MNKEEEREEAYFKPDREDRSGFMASHNPPDYILKKPIAHKSSRRASFHDYCAPNRYMITATTYPGSPPLSSIPDISLEQLKKGEMIMPMHSKLGEQIRREILDIPKFHPEIRILRFVIMPDHIRILLHIKERLRRKLGTELAGFFGACSKHRRKIFGTAEFKTLFQPFNDRIIFNGDQLEKAYLYVEDNPRRYIIKRMRPDLFRRYLHISINGHEYAAFGNIFLLKKIELLPIRIHRKWDESQFEKYTDKCMSAIESGAVPISPAIHLVEKNILKKAIEIGSSVIKLTDHGFEDRFKPQGMDFELCSEGRLLLLAPWPENIGRKSTAGYKEFHNMNDHAATIASLPPSARMTIR